jgi:tetratricopeptide (TPR) repeat protein
MSEPVFERYKEALKQGHVATFKGRPRDALQHYQEAARLAGHRALPFINIGSVLLQLGRAQEAIAAYDEALRRSPEDRQALSGKAAAMLASGKRTEAAALLQQIAKLEADETRQRAEEDDATQAAAWSGGPEALLLAAERATGTGNIDEAIGAYVGAAAGFAERNQLDAALDACQRALGLSLGAPAVHLQMARLYFLHGWNDRAVERLLLLERLLAFDNDPLAETGLRELAKLHSDADPRLATLAAGSA